jgi:hypothetical protein
MRDAADDVADPLHAALGIAADPLRGRRSLRQPPDRIAEQAGGDDREQQRSERSVRHRSDRALVIRDFAAIQSGIDGKPAYEDIDDATRGKTELGEQRSIRVRQHDCPLLRRHNSRMCSTFLRTGAADVRKPVAPLRHPSES